MEGPCIFLLGDLLLLGFRLPAFRTELISCMQLCFEFILARALCWTVFTCFLALHCTDLSTAFSLYLSWLFVGLFSVTLVSMNGVFCHLDQRHEVFAGSRT